MATEKFVIGELKRGDMNASHILTDAKHIRKRAHETLTHALPLKHSFHYHSYRRTHTHTHTHRHIFKVAIPSVWRQYLWWQALMPVSSLQSLVSSLYFISVWCVRAALPCVFLPLKSWPLLSLPLFPFFWSVSRCCGYFFFCDKLSFLLILFAICLVS